MSLLSGKEAAHLAEGVYNIQTARNGADATQIANRNVEQGIGVGRVEGVSASSGLMGSSGAFIKEQSGFGLVLDRGAASNRELIVVIRGTQSKSDWLSNFNVGFDAGPDGSLVHAGFNRIYRSFADDLRGAIRRNKPQKIHFVGHSLGGALATLAASEFAVRNKIPSYLYTFGAPRVGSLGLNSNLRSYLPETHIRRVYAISDPVPMIPTLPFVHLSPGSTGLNAGFSAISTSAHSMSACYVPNMPPAGWPPQVMLPNKSDPDYWLDQAERAPGFMSASGYYLLGKALSSLMNALNLLGIAVGVNMTILDRLIVAMHNAVLLSTRLAKTTYRLVKLALKLAGRAAIATTISLADLTMNFLRFVFDLLLAPVRMAARSAVGLLM